MVFIVITGCSSTSCSGFQSWPSCSEVRTLASLWAFATRHSSASSSSCFLWTSQRRSYRTYILQRLASSLWLPSSLSCPADMFETPHIWLLFWRWCCSPLLCCIHLTIGVTLLVEREVKTLAKMQSNWTSQYIRHWGRKSSTYLGLDTSCPMRPIPGAPSRKQAWEWDSWLFGLCCWFGFDCDVSERIDRKGKESNWTNWRLKSRSDEEVVNILRSEKLKIWDNICSSHSNGYQ